MAIATTYCPAPDLVVRKVGDEAVIVPVRTHVADLDSVVALNPVAARVWELLDGTRTADAIAAAICDEFEVTPDVALADVDELLRDLAGASLIQPAEGAR